MASPPSSLDVIMAQFNKVGGPERLDAGELKELGLDAGKLLEVCRNIHGVTNRDPTPTNTINGWSVLAAMHPDIFASDQIRGYVMLVERIEELDRKFRDMNDELRNVNRETTNTTDAVGAREARIALLGESNMRLKQEFMELTKSFGDQRFAAMAVATESAQLEPAQSSAAKPALLSAARQASSAAEQPSARAVPRVARRTSASIRPL